MFCVVAGFKCDADELKKYDFSKIKGDYSAKVSKKTPPSTTVTTWNIGICGGIKDVEECEGAEICGVTKVLLDLDEYITNVIKLSTEDAKVSFKPYGDKKSDKDSKKGIKMNYDEFKWGDQEITAQVDYICASKDDEDDDLDKLKLESWDSKSVKLSMKTKSACASKKLTKPDKKKADNGESWGWFTWIFIFFVLFLSIYIIGGAWFQYNKGNSIDFQTALKEVVENFVDVVKGLPIFIKEIVEKFTGNANRGEYSAV